MEGVALVNTGEAHICVNCVSGLQADLQNNCFSSGLGENTDSTKGLKDGWKVDSRPALRIA